MNPIRIAISPSSFAEFDDKPVQVLKEFGVEVVENPYKRRLTEEEAIQHLRGMDGLIAGLEPLNQKVLSSTDCLKAIARVGIGIANIDLEYAKERGIKVSNTPDGPTAAVAEMTLAALLALCRNIIPYNTAVHQGVWKKQIGIGVEGLKVLLVGYGRIGSKVSDLLSKVGAEIFVCDPFIESSQLLYEEKLITKEDGLKLADVISLHASGQEEIIGENEFALMKKGVLILNSARGELVNEVNLIGALKSGKVGSAWFDVFWEEPYYGQLTKFDNVLLTPHIGTYTGQCRLSMEMAAVENILRDLGLK